ncbi:DUF3429 domain-containing protein [Roseibium sp. RKSG952]|uniref:DUF3429 domain-containing protein n=1 Tax=Roseibium sp. RKSG952 TaxID=2529384 RepID=UPI0012BCCF6A|nr:DUF3429 domain-containing protein [Roseibium sp. RKSG952]MTI00368.1 DUF3429 domain-containing protein [Roseibium sp. RKSG952]
MPVQPLSQKELGTAPDGHSNNAIPKSALLLGVAGFLPFAVFCIAVILAPPRYVIEAQFALNFYGAVILSFMGGIHWGLEMARQKENEDAPALGALTLSVLPSLAAWASLALPVRFGSAALAVFFALTLAYDLSCAKSGRTPPWYPKLRIPLTVAVCVALLLPSLF